jgi:hypothetical protein
VELVNPSLEVSNLIISVHELNLMLLQLLVLLHFLLQVLDLLRLSSLEVCKLLGLSTGGLLCLVQEAAVPR